MGNVLHNIYFGNNNNNYYNKKKREVTGLLDYQRLPTRARASSSSTYTTILPTRCGLGTYENVSYLSLNRLTAGLNS